MTSGHNFSQTSVNNHENAPLSCLKARRRGDLFILNLDERRFLTGGLLEEWRQDYNRVRPHSSLGWLTPQEYAEKIAAKNFAGGHAPRQYVDGIKPPVYNPGMTPLSAGT